MRVLLVASVLFATADAFAPSTFQRCNPSLAMSTAVDSIDAVEVQSRLKAQMEKMKARDATSSTLSKEVSFCVSELRILTLRGNTSILIGRV